MGKILIIDDEELITRYLGKLIERLGHEAVTVSSATEGLARLASTDIDLIIADVRLQDAPDAQAWIHLLREKSETRPVVLISGAPSDELNTFATENGIIAFLSKPFELAFIKNVLDTVFGEK